MNRADHLQRLDPPCPISIVFEQAMGPYLAVQSDIRTEEQELVPSAAAPVMTHAQRSAFQYARAIGRAAKRIPDVLDVSYSGP